MMSPPADLVISPERQALLAPKLSALLADFAKLAILEDADLDPVSTEWLVRSYEHGPR